MLTRQIGIIVRFVSRKSLWMLNAVNNEVSSKCTSVERRGRKYQDFSSAL